MKKIALWGITAILFFSLVPTLVKAEVPTSDYHFKLDFSEEMNYTMDMKYVEKGNKNKLGLTKEKTKNTFLNMNIKIEEGNDSSYFDVSTVVKVGKDTYKGSYQGDMEKQLGEKGVFYFGPLEGTSKTKGKDEDSVLGLYFNPATNHAYVTVSIGEISDDGTGMLYFGEHNEYSTNEVNAIMDVEKSKTDNLENIDTTASTFNSVGPFSISSPMAKSVAEDTKIRWNYRITDFVGYLGDNQTNTDLPTNFTNINKNVGILNVYTISWASGESEAWLQLFSHTDNVANYYTTKNGKSFGANVHGFNLLFTGPEYLNVQETHPEKGNFFSLPEYSWAIDHWVSKNDYVEIVANLLRIKPAIQYADDTNSANKVYYRNVKVRDSLLQKSLDYPAGNDYSKPYIHSGGFAAYHLFTWQNGRPTPTIEPVGRILYAVGDGTPAWTYVWTGRLMEADFLAESK
ncbi:hypothetical protein [Bacillus sp. SM2101]|uniref:hypothetical protein n=1 Tax=Bacillus sp. SM2101 TaxID=2805366 RepID=UPI001BDDF76E|nr:hypothetical protein [Bacillus sp. SM2101]